MSALMRGAAVRVGAPLRARCGRRAGAVSVRAAAAASADLLPTSVTLAKLKESPNGRMTKNVDGALLTLTYDAATDSVTVEDPRRGVRFVTSIGKDSIIRIDPAATTPIGFAALGDAAGTDALLAQLQLGALRPGPEIINGRAAMIGFLGVALTEIGTGRSAWAQIGSGSFFTAAFLLAAVSAASVAPLLTGAVSAAKVFPSETDSFADERLPVTWTPTAEVVNGRVAMAAFLLLLLEELVTGHAAL